MEFIDCEQGSEQWKLARLGRATCSEMDCLLVNGKGEAGFGAGALSYMDQLIGEQITGEIADPFQGNRHTERGHELEGVARGLYEARYAVSTSPCGIILNHGQGYAAVGYSPDALVAADGLTEIKTKLPKFQVGVILADEVPKEHIAQCQGGLWVSEREWLDFISYWPGMPLFVKRVYRDEALIRQIAERVATFNELLQERLKLVMRIG